MDSKETTRRRGVLVKLNETEHRGLQWLQEREVLPKAQILRRLLLREVRAGHAVEAST